MHLGGLLSTQEARVALKLQEAIVALKFLECDFYASFVLSNLPHASMTRWSHVTRLPFLNSRSESQFQMQLL